MLLTFPEMPSRGLQGTEPPKASTPNTERPREATQAEETFDPEEEWLALGYGELRPCRRSAYRQGDGGKFKPRPGMRGTC